MIPSLSQKNFMDTLWLNERWTSSLKSTAKYYRIHENTKNGFLVYDKYLNGQTQMMAEASAIKPELICNGGVIYYSEKGEITSKGNFLNGKKIGTWISYFDNGKDSSVTVYQSGGKQEMIRRSKHDEIYTIVEKQAEFPGGISEMIKYLQNELKYPSRARKLGLGGKVFLKFVVSEKGEIDNVEVLKGSGDEEMDNEAVKVVQDMPLWTPASMTGVNVKCYFNLPLSFTLTEPFYTFNLNSENKEYIKMTKLIFDGKLEEAYKVMNKVGSETDVDFLYNKAVLLFNSKESKSSCKAFERVLEIADNKSSAYYNSKKFHKQYCN